jgi:NADH:flavin oxidoreductase / NADH oxidase family
MAEYYAQRASPGGLIVTESAEITPEASAYEAAPGIFTEAQMAGWRKVTDAIHRKEGYVFLQLWHSGRVSHPDLTGVAPVSASATGSTAGEKRRWVFQPNSIVVEADSWENLAEHFYPRRSFQGNEGDYAAAEKFWSPQYIQHSAHIGPGREGIFDLIKNTPATLIPAPLF